MPMQEFTILPSIQLAMTRQYPPKPYTNLADLTTAIHTKSDQVYTEGISQYLSFNHISPETFHYIGEHRSELGRKVRFAYYPDIATLIIKVLTREEEIAQRNIGEEITLQCRGMGITFDEYLAIGATKYVGPTGSENEADSSWINPTLRPDGWPLLVLEAGLSESMPLVRQAPAWWISNSGGQVRIVLLIIITRATGRVVLEKYIPKQMVYPRTRARAGLPEVGYVPELVSTTTVNHGIRPPSVNGDRLVLEFDRVIGRAPVLPEGDIECTSAMLVDATRYVFRGEDTRT
ncbi:hypothetical protein BO78DRAFT_381815 [Aspergillus sclerotiicarbonarius CBS 121057]|uniref:Uncharacterized protein n=1 Tax=Aspergillus sclerotiicarbonarius (strain CBS 121057 / IBT 28362) TaxID=1448318 RepID=A0A319ER01_ASPSB|nr:hypothetical protein BO78DRAFT_381815 [Aspergillus sclerotiicarbonarius CBS 121057]